MTTQADRSTRTGPTSATNATTDGWRYVDHLPPDHSAAALRQDVRTGLTADPKWLPPRWFYDRTGSELFERITELPEYYPTRCEAEILTEHAAEIMARAGARAGDVVVRDSRDSYVRSDGRLVCALGVEGLAVIDTPPALTVAIQAAIHLAELIVVPTRPSPHDLRAVGATVDLCERAGKPLIFVVNAATPKARITSEAAVALSQHGTVAPVTIHQRTDFAASMIDGRTVMEVDPNGKSAAEVTALWSYMSDRLEKNFRRTVFTVPGNAVAGIAARPQAAGFGRRVVA